MHYVKKYIIAHIILTAIVLPLMFFKDRAFVIPYFLIIFMMYAICQASSRNINAYIMKNYPDFYEEKKSPFLFTIDGKKAVNLNKLSKEEINSLGNPNIGTYISSMQIYTAIFFVSFFLAFILAGAMTNIPFTIPSYISQLLK